MRCRTRGALPMFDGPFHLAADPKAFPRARILSVIGMENENLAEKLRLRFRGCARALLLNNFRLNREIVSRTPAGCPTRSARQYAVSCSVVAR